MSVKPILFNTDMVRALQDGTKTATRRPVKPHYREGEAGFRVVTNKHTGQYVRIEIFDEWEDETRWLNEPYRPGDILYVRETWRVQSARRFDADARIMFKVGGDMVRIQFPGGGTQYHSRRQYDAFVSKWADDRWHPSIHMPREAARIFLRVTGLRVERLRKIDGRGILAEGIDNGSSNPAMGKRFENMQRMAFQRLWDSTIKKADRALYGWTANPWVWVISFELISREEAEL